MCKYLLRDAGNSQALIISRLFREPDGLRWGFQALGQPCRGKTWKDSLPELLRYAVAKPTELQRTMTEMSMPPPGRHRDPLARQSSVVGQDPLACGGKEGCIVQ